MYSACKHNGLQNLPRGIMWTRPGTNACKTCLRLRYRLRERTVLCRTVSPENQFPHLIWVKGIRPQKQKRVITGAWAVRRIQKRWRHCQMRYVYNHWFVTSSMLSAVIRRFPTDWSGGCLGPNEAMQHALEAAARWLSVECSGGMPCAVAGLGSRCKMIERSLVISPRYYLST